MFGLLLSILNAIGLLFSIFLWPFFLIAKILELCIGATLSIGSLITVIIETSFRILLWPFISIGYLFQLIITGLYNGIIGSLISIINLVILSIGSLAQLMIWPVVVIVTSIQELIANLILLIVSPFTSFIGYVVQVCVNLAIAYHEFADTTSKAAVVFVGELIKYALVIILSPLIIVGSLIISILSAMGF